jgi:hypothetical protein
MQVVVDPPLAESFVAQSHKEVGGRYSARR